MIKVATIARNTADSPNMAANDAAILERVTALLRECGANVAAIGEEEEIPRGTQVVCSMSRTAATIERLKRAEQQGVIVINPTTAVENCSRKQFMEILRRNGIPQPAYSIINGAAGLTSECYPCWIKKANGWSNHKDDICYAQNSNEATRAIEQMAQRGIKEFILMQHCTGDIVKFYGIADRLFHYSYPGSGKFGHEEINGAPKHYTFDAAALKDIAHRAARAIGLEIYGGDAIITPQGEIFIIDINDFPSFTAVREAAAAEIAQLITSKTKQL